MSRHWSSPCPAGRCTGDGTVVGDANGLVKGGRLQRVDGLWGFLRAACEQWKVGHPGKPWHGAALFAFDKSDTSVVVTSVLQTAAFAGFPSARFAVRGNNGRVQRLDVGTIVPGPPGVPASTPGARLVVVVRPSKLVLEWRQGEAIVSTTAVASVRDLSDRVRRDSAQYAAVHRESADKAFDQATVYVGDDVDYGELVAVVDAIRQTAREIEVGEAKERVPAIDVNFGIAKDVANIGEGDSVPGRARLPPEAIQRIIRQNFDRLKTCYEQGLARDKSLAGIVRVRFVIQTDGKVADVGDAGKSTMPDGDVVACILSNFGELAFPPPRGGAVTVVYPIRFRPDDSAGPVDVSLDGGVDR